MKKLLTTLLISSLALSLGAQTNGSNSPYSRYGIGLLNNRAGAAATGMAGTGIAMRNNRDINPLNAASFSAVDSLTFLFDAGMALQNGNLRENGQSINAHNTSLDYVNIAFRAFKNLGVAAGIQPISTIGYEMKQSNTYWTSTGEQTQTSTYYGDGGLHAAYLGLGWQPVKGLSIGASGGYMWGEAVNAITATFSESSVSSRERSYNSHLHSYKLDFGLQYALRVNKNHTLMLGMTYGLGHGMKGSASYYDTQGSLSGMVGDTIVVRNAFEWPHSFGVGLAWNYKEKLRVGFDYTLTKWGKCKVPNLESDGTAVVYRTRTGLLKDEHKFSAGAEYIAHPDGLRWYQLIRYRLGVAMRTPYTIIGDHDGPSSYLVSFGAAIPVINSYNTRCLVNIGAQYEHVRPKVSGMLKEHYLRICIGITFNEMWFAKWKAE